MNGALPVRRQREDGSGLGNLHDGLAEKARSPGSCTSTRAVGCSLRASAEILRPAHGETMRSPHERQGSPVGLW